MSIIVLQVRQLAAVELRKRIIQKSGDLWIKVPQAERDELKAKLPEITLAEPVYVSLHPFMVLVLTCAPQQTCSALIVSRYLCHRIDRNPPRSMAGTSPFLKSVCDVASSRAPRSRNLHFVHCVGEYCRGIPGAPAVVVQAF